MKRLLTGGLIFFAALIGICAKGQSTKGFHLINTFHIASAGGWDYIAVSPGNNRLYVSHGTQVNILDKTTGDSVGVIENTTGVHGIAFDSKSGKGFTSNGKINTVTVFDLASNKVLSQIATGENPDAILYESFSQKIITCNGRSKNLSVIDPITEKVIATIPVGGKPEAAVTDGTGRLFVNVEDKNEVVAINTQTFEVIAHWPTGPGEAPTGLAIDLNTKRLFAGCSDNKLLVVMDASTGKLVSQLAIGDGCDGVAFDNSTKNIFASCGDGTLTVITEKSANEFMVTENVATKKGARTIAVDEKLHLVYLPAADFYTAAPPDSTNPKPRPSMIPGTFCVLVYGKTI